MITKNGLPWYADPDFSIKDEAAYWADVAYQRRRESARLAAARDAEALEYIYGRWAAERASLSSATAAAEAVRRDAIAAAERAYKMAIDAAERAHGAALDAEGARHAAALDALRRHAIAALLSEEAVDAQLEHGDRADRVYAAREDAAARRRAWRRAYYRRKLSKYPSDVKQ